MNKILQDLTHSILTHSVPTNFEGTMQDVEDTLREEMKKLIGTPALYRRNKNDVFELIERNVDEILPKEVMSQFAPFAQVERYAQGQVPVFRRKLGRVRAKQFVTQVGPAGQYETFRLDAENYTVNMKAYGAGVRIDYERYLDGLESLIELYSIVIERMSEIVYEEIQKALLASWNHVGRPAANKKSVSAFDAKAMVELCGVVSAYGSPVILCSPQFAAEMTNAIDYQKYTPNIPGRDLEEIREYGFIGTFRSYPVVVMNQSFVDETNSKFVINPKIAYVLPQGRDKIVRIAYEGNTQVQEQHNVGDWSDEIMIYLKMGVAINTPLNYWGIYQNTGIVAEGWDDLS